MVGDIVKDGGADNRLEQARQQAMALFWTQGVGATSYADLVAATGLSRKALYVAWPDKNALVAETIQLYRDTVLTSILETVATAPSLSDFWDQFEAELKAADWAGCYLFRSASGELRKDAFVKGVFDSYTQALAHAFAQKLQIEGFGEADALARGWQVVALQSLMSAIGGTCGFGPRAEELLDVARGVCGVGARTRP